MRSALVALTVCTDSANIQGARGEHNHEFQALAWPIDEVVSINVRQRRARMPSEPGGETPANVTVLAGRGSYASRRFNRIAAMTKATITQAPRINPPCKVVRTIYPLCAGAVGPEV